MNGNAQTPYSNYQTKNAKPNVQRSTNNVLIGNFAGSMNGGHNRTMTYAYVMANQSIDKMYLKMKIKTLTPLTPPYQNLNMTVRVYNVPHKRVFKNYEKFFGQRGGASEEKITELPNFGGKLIPYTLPKQGSNKHCLLTDTTVFRDSFVSSYIPRIGLNTFEENGLLLPREMPKTSALPLRGRICIYNEFERNKEYDEPATEFDEDTVSIEEWDLYMNNQKYDYNRDFYEMRAKKPNNYYTDYRTELQGFEAQYPPSEMSRDTSLENWMANFESLIAESRSEAENANLNENELIAKLRGSQLLTEGRVTQLNEKTFSLNYSSITQSTYNNEADNMEFKAMGTQGAYSYTEVKLPILEQIKFKEDGIIHIIAEVWADTVYENGFDRMDLNVDVFDLYRPDLVEQKKDVLYKMECGVTASSQSQLNYEEIKGFKRKFNEYFKLRNTIQGDMTTAYYFQNTYDDDYFESFNPEETPEQILLTQNTYQFYETSDDLSWIPDKGQYIYKNSWKDYTDLLINKNLAYTMPVLNGTKDDKYYVMVLGQNQICYVGQIIMSANLPIENSIKSNFTSWGEH